MQTRTKKITVTRLADLAHPGVTCKGIESGRLNWESKKPGDLIAMFAAGGYDVINDGDGEDSRSRLVKDQTGNIVAYIMWCISVPDFACSFTSKV